jgi:hypothetical protein
MNRYFSIPILVLLIVLSLASANAQNIATKDLPIFSRGSGVVLKVPDYETARRQLLLAAQSQGAEQLNAQTYVNAKGQKHGWLELRLNSVQLRGLLNSVYTVGKLYSEKMTVVDNLSDYQGLSRRINSLKSHELRLAGVLESPRRIRGSDILYLQERLYRANVDEGMMQQQQADIARSSQLCSVRIELFEPGTMPVSEPAKIDLSRWFASSYAFARRSLTMQMARASTATAYLLVYAPIWVPALIVIMILMRWIWIRGNTVLRRILVFGRVAAHDLRASCAERRGRGAGSS